MKKTKTAILLSFLLVLDIIILYPQNFNNAIIPYSQPLDLDFNKDIFIQSKDNLTKDLSKTQFSKDYINNYLTYNPVRDPKRLAINSGLLFGAAMIDFAILWSAPEEMTKWEKREIFKKDLQDIGLYAMWKENVESGPIMDDDGIFFNWISHPWVGGIYYMTARGSGFKRWESFTYSVIMSTLFWEYGLEAVSEVPSWQDIVITPIIGSLIGELFFKWKGKIIRNERKVLNSRFLGGTSLFLMDPFNQILDGFGYKAKDKIHTYSVFSPVEYDFASGKPVWGMQVVILF
jgi:hypothetical protein